MWAIRCGAKPRWPSRIKVIFFSFMSGTLGLSLYMYMAGLNTSSLDLSEPASEHVLCLYRWPMRYDKVFVWQRAEDGILWHAPGTSEDFLSQYECTVPDMTGASCRDMKLAARDLARPLALAMGGTDGQNWDLLGIWALLFLCLTFVVWLGVTIHDLALIGQTQKDFVLDVTGVNRHSPLIRRVWKVLAGFTPLTNLASADHMCKRVLGNLLAILLAPVLLAWNLVLFLFVICPMILLAFVRYPIRMSRAWVFIISLVCTFYGLALTLQQLAFISSLDLRPRYALTWQTPVNVTSAGAGMSLCTCGCDYSISFGVCLNLGVIGVLTTMKSAFLAFRCLKGLRRSQWANLLTVQFPVPLTVYSVNWRQANNEPIKYRTEDMPVQGEVAFDPFAMMDEQPDSSYMTVHLRPEPTHNYLKTEQGALKLVQPHRKLETPAIPMPASMAGAHIKALESEYIGCCGFPWPTGGHKCVYDDDFLAALEASGIELGGNTPTSGTPVRGSSVGLWELDKEESSEQGEEPAGCTPTPSSPSQAWASPQEANREFGVGHLQEKPEERGRHSGRIFHAASTSPLQRPRDHSPPCFSDADSTRKSL